MYHNPAIGGGLIGGGIATGALPLTGFDAILPVVTGTILILSGLLLQRAARVAQFHSDLALDDGGGTVLS